MATAVIQLPNDYVEGITEIELTIGEAEDVGPSRGVANYTSIEIGNYERRRITTSPLEVIKAFRAALDQIESKLKTASVDLQKPTNNSDFCFYPPTRSY